jgi:hypothetical protein
MDTNANQIKSAPGDWVFLGMAAQALLQSPSRARQCANLGVQESLSEMVGKIN